jgi:hypothetical protein
MPRKGWSNEELDERVLACVKGTGRGLTYGRVVDLYSRMYECSLRTAKNHLKQLGRAIDNGGVTAVGRYQGKEGKLYGDPRDEKFVQAKEDANRPPAIDRPDSIFHLGGVYNHSPMSLEWTTCPFKNRIIKTQIVTLGIADFMVCSLCSRYHFLGVSPKMQDQRVYAWQIDPLANAEEYADELTCRLIGNPRTYRAQGTRIERIRNGGHYVGLLYRSSWDHDPSHPEVRKGAPLGGEWADVPVRNPSGSDAPSPVTYLRRGQRYTGWGSKRKTGRIGRNRAPRKTPASP